MNNEVSPQQLRTVGTPIDGFPEIPPRQEGSTLYGLVTTGKASEFTVPIGDGYRYGTYRKMTKHPKDGGNWIFCKTELFFFPDGPAPPESS